MTGTEAADVAIWGRVPPPIGGMAVHLERLLPCLHERGIRTQMYGVGRPTPEHPDVIQVSERRLRWLLTRFGRGTEPVHYVFSDDTRARFAASTLSAFGGKRVILRIGGNSLERALDASSAVERAMIRFALRSATAVVGVSPTICALARKAGARDVRHIPGFIAPPRDGSTVDPEVEGFLARESGPVVLGAGEVWDPVDGDIYGAYDFLDLLEALPGIRVVFYAYEISPLGESPVTRFRAEIARRGLDPRILVHESTGALWPAMERCDLMLRPSRSDGDSNAIREALALGQPVVASDCVERPRGTVVYALHDPSAMVDAVRGALDDLPAARRRVAGVTPPDNAGATVDLLESLLEGQAR